jgi:hypothetical protein
MNPWNTLQVHTENGRNKYGSYSCNTSIALMDRFMT